MYFNCIYNYFNFQLKKNLIAGERRKSSESDEVKDQGACKL